MGLHPAIADVRNAVRRALADVPRGSLALAACSGGADSLALAAALAFVAPRLGLRGGVLTVDHGLQEGSGRRAEDVVRLACSMGLEPVEILPVKVGDRGGPEAAAREARYATLADWADRLKAQTVLLGHTRDDQAETVLLGLVRGSGPRSLAGMPAVAGAYRRPFLELDRYTTRKACAALGLTPWDDPHNSNPAFTRVRVRQQVIPVLEEELGPGVAAALARTATLCREDADALDGWALRVYAAMSADGGLPTDELAVLPTAVRRRVIRYAAVDAGAPPGSLGAVHVLAVDRLITEWRGQKRVDLPGGVGAIRRYGRLLFADGHELE